MRWFQDRTHGSLPTAMVISVPMLVYRGAMLAWSLWMALSLLRWLKWLLGFAIRFSIRHPWPILGTVTAAVAVSFAVVSRLAYKPSKVVGLGSA